MVNNEGLWKLYKTRNDAAAREKLILAYSYLAKYVVDRLPARPSAVMSHDDLLGHAIVGLIDAIEKFDIHREIKFETYAVTRIRGSVLDALKSLDWMPRSIRQTERRMRDVVTMLEAQLGRPAQDQEIADAMGMTIDETDKLFSDMGHAAVLSLEEILGYGDDGATGDLPAADDADPLAAVAEEHGRILLAKAVGTLPEKEKLVVGLYYNEGLTFKEIAKILGVTESRICQLHSKAVVRLNGKLARHTDLLLQAA